MHFYAKYKITKNIALMIFCMILLFTSFSAVFADEAKYTGEKNDKIRVGYFLLDGFQEKDKSGNYSGYGYEYLESLASYTGWKYEFVEASYDKCLEMLKIGEIDIMGLVNKTPQTESEFGFSTLKYGIDLTSLFTRSDNRDLPFADFKSFDGITMGILDDEQQLAQISKYCSENDFTVKTKTYRTKKQLLKAVDTKKVEAAMLSTVQIPDNYRIIAQFDPSEFYFATAKNNSDILSDLNFAMEQLKIAQPYFEVDLYEKYLDSHVSGSPVFTKSELEYIKEHPTITFACDSNWRPIEYIDEDTKEYSGIGAGIFKQISKYSGLKFKFASGATCDEALDNFKNGKAQGITLLNQNYSWSSMYDVKLSQTILNVPMIMISSPEKDHAKIAALPEGYYSLADAARSMGYSNIIYKKDYSECFEAVYKGEAGATFANTYVSNYYLGNPRYMSFIFANVPDYSESLSIAVAKDSDPALLSIIKKSLNAITNSDLQKIVLDNTLTVDNNGLFGFVYIHPLGTVLLFLGIFLLIAALLLILTISSKRHSRKIHEMMYKDSITGRPNIKHFLDSAPKLLKEHPESNYALLYIDILHFKYINDTFGYDAGDDLLIKVSDFLNDILAEGELAAREHADHFVVLLKYADQAELDDRLKSMIAKAVKLNSENKNYVLVVNSGVYLFKKGETNMTMAIDLANYAKGTLRSSFKSQFVYYTESMREQIAEEKAMETSMRHAIDRKEFIPFIQPKVDILTGKIVGGEALVKWQHPEKGLLAPDYFVPFFEKTGYVTLLDYYIFEAVCKFMQTQIDNGEAVVPISSNFSRLHLLNPNFVNNIVTVADKYHIPHHLLELELTETITAENLLDVADTSKDLQARGFRTSIDDFGSGYSSLNLLQSVPIDALKLDRDFIYAGLTGKLEHELVSSLTEVAIANDIDIICEGIENDEQEAFVKEIGCHIIQGFKYYKPMRIEEFRSIINK